MFSYQVWSWLVAVNLGLASLEQRGTHFSPFRPIEQPLTLKIAITITGLIIIGLECHWFLNKKP
jgi:plastocyanin domain-containing protein